MKFVAAVATLLIAAAGVIVFQACKQRNDVTINKPTESDNICGLCMASYDEVSEDQIILINKYLIQHNINDRNEYDYHGVIEINNDSINYSLVVLDNVSNSESHKNHKIYLIDNDISQVVSENDADINVSQTYYECVIMNNGLVISDIIYEYDSTNTKFYVDDIVCGPTIGDNIAECIAIAISACVNDPWCAFMCGITYEYCLPATILACTLHHAFSGGSTAVTNA